MSSKAGPSSWSKILNTIAKLRGKTRKVKHLYDEIPKTRYNILDKGDKAKYTLLRNGIYVLKTNTRLYAPPTAAFSQRPTSETLNRTARNRRASASWPPSMQYSLSRVRQGAPKSARMTPTGSPLSPMTKRNTSMNRVLNSYSDLMKTKIREHASSQDVSIKEVLTLLAGFKKETQERIEDYIKQNPESPLGEVLDFIPIMGE